ncbi:MAG: cadherin-like domain-containing protein [Pacificimonas sp.]
MKRIDDLNEIEAGISAANTQSQAIPADLAALAAAVSAEAGLSAAAKLEATDIVADVAVAAPLAAEADADDVAVYDLSDGAAGNLAEPILLAQMDDGTMDDGTMTADVDDDNDGFGSGEYTALYVLGGILLVGGLIAILSDDDDDDEIPAPPVDTNTPPTLTINNDDLTLDEDTDFTFDITADDADGDVLAISGTSDNGTVTVGDDGSVIFTPDADFDGDTDVTITVDDGNGGSVSETVTLTVNDTDGPAATIVSLDEDDDDDQATAREFDADGDNFAFTDDVAVASNVRIVNFEEGDLILGSDDDDVDYSFSSTADGITISSRDGNDVSSIFIEADTDGAFINDEDSAEDALGFDFFRNGDEDRDGPGDSDDDDDDDDGDDDGSDGDLDQDDDDDAATPAQFDADGNDFAFIDDAANASNVAIANFAAGDTIVVSNVSDDGATFARDGDDVSITFEGDDGTNNTIVLTGIASDLDADVEITDEASAETALDIGDFFSTDDDTDGGDDDGGDDGDGDDGDDGDDDDGTTGGDLDDDDDDDTDTDAQFDAGDDDVAFTDDANVASSVTISNFEEGDTIDVTNIDGFADFATAGDDNEDVVISFTGTDGTLNQITLEGVADGVTDTIVDEATAEQALGFDFFTAG